MVATGNRAGVIGHSNFIELLNFRKKLIFGSKRMAEAEEVCWGMLKEARYKIKQARSSAAKQRPHRRVE
jgi:hypothetical protein